MRIVGGRWKGLSIDGPQGKDVTRPTTDRVREAMASMVLNVFDLDMSRVSVLDAFAGSGAIGTEFLSRGASHVTFVDRDKDATNRIRNNMRTLKAQASEYSLYTGDIFQLTTKALLGAPFSCIVLDPPYKMTPDEVDKLLCSLESLHAIEDNACIIYEHAKHTPGLNGDHLKHVKQKKYGSTLVELYSFTPTSI